MVKLDRKTAFDRIRPALYPKGLNQSQVDGWEYLFSAWERSYQDRTPIVQLANVLAQTYLETAHTMQPIHEYGNADYFFRMYDIGGSRPAKAKELGNINPGDGVKFAGMGYIQSTGRANARRATRRLRELGLIGPDVDIEETPELLMRPEYAVHVLFVGMEEGWFTGRKLDDMIDVNIDGDEHADFIAARRIINGTDRAGDIADYSDVILGALKVAQRVETSVSAQHPVPPAVEHVDTPAVPPVAAPTPAEPAPKGWFAHLLDLLRSGRSA